MPKLVFGHMRTASPQPDQGLRCPLTETLDTNSECINGGQYETLRMRGVNLNLCILLMLENDCRGPK